MSDANTHRVLILGSGPAGLRTLDDGRREVGARRVERGGQAGRTGAEDEDAVVLRVGHEAKI